MRIYGKQLQTIFVRRTKRGTQNAAFRNAAQNAAPKTRQNATKRSQNAVSKRETRNTLASVQNAETRVGHVPKHGRNANAERAFRNAGFEAQTPNAAKAQTARR